MSRKYSMGFMQVWTTIDGCNSHIDNQSALVFPATEGPHHEQSRLTASASDLAARV